MRRAAIPYSIFADGLTQQKTPFSLPPGVPNRAVVSEREFRGIWLKSNILNPLDGITIP